MNSVEEPPSADAYWNLFQTTGWNEEYRFTKQELAQAIRQSWCVISVYEGSQLIGFGRVIADRVHHALIVDLIVHPDHQVKGLESMLLSKLVIRCKENQIRDVQLFAAQDKYAFYEKFGFEKRPGGAPGMQLKKVD